MKKICIVTGTRAEYGLLKPLIKKFIKAEDFKLQLIVTGMHLSQEFGLTYKEIINDGFLIDEKIEILLSSDTSIGVSKSIGLALISFSEAYDRLKPDMVLVLGDRYEIFAAVSSAYISKIPVAHLHGGETTEGAFDEGFRHSITKMSYLHFTSTETYRDRVIQLGEHPDRVFNVGAIGIENINNISFIPRDELENILDFKFNKKTALITFHPTTLDDDTTEAQLENLLKAISSIDSLNSIFTGANSDNAGRLINKVIENYCIKNSHRAKFFLNMGQLNYLSAMSYCDLVIGNSSSGIIEAPTLEVPTVNIGDRQKGRIQCSSIINCNPYKKEIETAINLALSQEFKYNIAFIENPYGDGMVSDKIVDLLKKAFEIGITPKKSFYDLSQIGGQNLVDTRYINKINIKDPTIGIIDKLTPKKVVCFACFTTPNIVTSYILAKTVYKDDCKVLLLSDWNCEEVYKKLIELSPSIKIWDKVILIKEKGQMTEQQRFLSIKAQLNLCNISKVDVLHYFQFNPNSYLAVIFNYMSSKTPIIHTAFTAASYYVKEYYLYVKGLLQQNKRTIDMDIDRISEIWLYDKQLYIDRLLQRPLKDLDFHKYFSNPALLKQFCRELNVIFGYNYKPLDYDVIFLDQPLEKFITQPIEDNLFKDILKQFSGTKVLIKSHPRCVGKDKYKSLGVKVLNENKVPWEVLFLNELVNKNLDNKIFVSYFSDSLVTTHMFLNKLGIKHSALRLRGILAKYSKIPIGDERFEDFTSKLTTFYGENLYNINSIQDIKRIVAKNKTK